MRTNHGIFRSENFSFKSGSVGFGLWFDYRLGRFCDARQYIFTGGGTTLGSGISLGLGAAVMCLIAFSFKTMHKQTLAMEAEKLKAEEAGMNAHVAKPIDIPSLMATLQRVLSR